MPQPPHAFGLSKLSRANLNYVLADIGVSSASCKALLLYQRVLVSALHELLLQGLFAQLFEFLFVDNCENVA